MYVVVAFTSMRTRALAMLASLETCCITAFLTAVESMVIVTCYLRRVVSEKVSLVSWDRYSMGV